jgi:hypothetical protein
MRIEVPIERLHELFSYDPATGIITNRKHRLKTFIGKEAGWITPKGYRSINVGRRGIRAHRIAFAMTFGRWPSGEIDHINGVRGDNRICNLREATSAENCRNAKTRRDNSSGLKGVHKHPLSGRWGARITVNKKTRNLGYFDTANEASEAYRNAADLHFGEFANHGGQSNA